MKIPPETGNQPNSLVKMRSLPNSKSSIAYQGCLLKNWLSQTLQNVLMTVLDLMQVAFFTVSDKVIIG